MILDLDVGNTRVKWRCGTAGGAVVRSDDWREAIAAECGAGTRMRVANVAGAQVAEEINNWARRRWRIVPEFAAVSTDAAGVKCAYREPSRLGVDRWLALLAAHRRWRENLVVVSAGSALTLDLLRADGQHLGGYIVPGLEMQRRALFAGTKGVQVEPAEVDSLAPGKDTAEAVLRGRLAMAVAFIERAAAMAAATSVVLTGGDADRIAPFLSLPVNLDGDLVLDGLAVLMP